MRALLRMMKCKWSLYILILVYSFNKLHNFCIRIAICSMYKPALLFSYICLISISTFCLTEHVPGCSVIPACRGQLHNQSGLAESVIRIRQPTESAGHWPQTTLRPARHQGQGQWWLSSQQNMLSLSLNRATSETLAIWTYFSIAICFSNV